MSTADQSSNIVNNQKKVRKHLRECNESMEEFEDAVEKISEEARELRMEISAMHNKLENQADNVKRGEISEAGKQGKEVMQELEERIKNEIQHMASQLQVDLNLLRHAYEEASEAEDYEGETIEELREEIKSG